MTRRQTMVLGVLSLLALLTIFVGFSLYTRYENRSTDVSNPPVYLIDFELLTSRGIPWSSSTLQNKVVVINFWAPWCLPCRNEIPYLIDIHRRYGSTLQVVGIAIDQREPVRRFEDEAGINYTSLIAEIGGIELMGLYGNDGQLPLTLVFDRDGQLQRRALGQFNPTTLQRWLEQLL